MSFKDKLTKQGKSRGFKSPTGDSSNPSTPREYYPKSIGIYCVENPKVDRRAVRPYVIGVPPTHRTPNIEFKGSVFPTTPCWYGKLFHEPIIIEMGYYPANALYIDTDTPIFPNSTNTFDKKIPLLEKETGVSIPLEYDQLTPVLNERKRIADVLAKKVSEKGRAYLEGELVRLNGMADDGVVRTRHEVKIIPKVYIPMLGAVTTEEEDAEGDLITRFEPKLFIFEETMGAKKAASLVANKVLEEKSDKGGMMDYLYGEIEGAVGQPIQLFRNPLASEGKDSLPPLCGKLIEDKIPKALLPYFNIEIAPNIDTKSLLRLIVLEMIGLFAPKGDTSSIEGKLKEIFWQQVQKDKEEN